MRPKQYDHTQETTHKALGITAKVCKEIMQDLIVTVDKLNKNSESKKSKSIEILENDIIKKYYKHPTLLAFAMHITITCLADHLLRTEQKKLFLAKTIMEM